MENVPLRQFELIKNLYVHHYGFGVEVKRDEWQKWLRLCRALK